MLSFWAGGLTDGIPGDVFWLSAGAALLIAALAAAYYGRPRSRVSLRQAAGSRVALAIGDLFAPSDRFTGFVHGESGASVVLMELPFAAFEQLQNLGAAAGAFEAQGVSSVTQQTLPGRSGDYIFLRGEQKTALVDYAKYILIFRDDELTGMVTANIPKAALTSGLITGAEIEAILKSAEIKPDAPQAPKLFTLGYLGPFEEDLSLLGMTKGYRLKAAERESLGAGELQPIFLVAPSLTQTPISDLDSFAERTFNGIDQVRGKFIEEIEPRKIAGLSAVEVLGRGVDAASGLAAVVYQLVVEAPHGGYFRLVGLAPESARGALLPEFRKMAESIRPTV